METEQMSTKRSLIILGSFIIIIGSTLVIPAKWVGIKPTPYQTINLGNELTPIARLVGDTNHNKTPDWKDLATESLGTTTKEMMAKTPIDPVVQQHLDDPNNLTASFSKNMYISSAYIKQSGNTTEADQQKLVDTMVKGEASKIEYKTYIQNDLNILRSETSTDKKRYGNALGVLTQKATDYKMVDEDLEILKQYLKTKDASLLSPFVVKRDRLDNLIKSMITMPVPLSAVVYHIAALNAISKYRTTLDSFSKADSDPVRSLISYNDYLPTAKALFNNLNAMRNYFKSENITFTSGEPGYIFSTNVQMK